MLRSLFSKAATNWVYKARGEVNRIEACFSGAAYAPHRHDAYTIGITLRGVQSFDYMGAERHSLPGGMVVLYPDEVHDGRAGTDAGFRYRAVYIEPSLIQSVLGGKHLPFIEGGASTDPRLFDAVSPLLEDYDQPLETLEYQDALYDLATVLDEVSDAGKTNAFVNYEAAELARQYILEQLDQGISLEDLEKATGCDRWQLSRDFRAMFGTSPYRYLILRRLDKAQRMILAGAPLAGAATACAFADQSHFTRCFKKTYGVTPKKWIRTLGDDVGI